MKDNAAPLISTSVLKQSFMPAEESCAISPHALYFIQKHLREKGAGNELTGDIKINAKVSNKDGFHKSCFDILENNGKEKNYRCRLNGGVTAQLRGFKDCSREFSIEPAIFSKKFGVVGEPDVIFLSKERADILELKRKTSNAASIIDGLQVEIYMAIFEMEDSSIICNGSKPACIGDEYKPNISGHVLYSDGKLIKIQTKNKTLIHLKASSLQKEIQRYKSIYNLPLPEKCFPDCINARYCQKRNSVFYENNAPSSGRAKGKSRAYRARA